MYYDRGVDVSELESYEDISDDDSLITGYAIVKIKPETTWYHGTTADEFDTFRPGRIGGISLTSDYNSARTYSTMLGGYFNDFDSIIMSDNDPRVTAIKEGRPRVISVQIDPNNGPIELPAYTYDDLALDEYTDTERHENEFWMDLHDEAASYARRNVYPGYFIHHSPSGWIDLTWFDPNDRIEIVDQTVQGEVSLLDRKRSMVSDAVEEYKKYQMPDERYPRYLGTSSAKANAPPPNRGRGRFRY